MKKDDTVYLRHLLDAVAQIQEYLSAVSFEEFLQKRLVQDGVVRQLEIIGEASRNLSPEFRQAHPEIPWREIIAMRNRVVHAYFDVNLPIVWEVAQRDLPELKGHVDRILQAMEGQ